MTEKLASVDLRQGEYIISTYSKTSAGFWVLDGTPARMPQESPADELGTTIRNALDQSREGLDNPGRDGKPGQPLLDLLGLLDYATYAKGTRSVEVYVEPSSEGEAVEVTPQRNEGSQDGFTPIDDEMREFTYNSPLQLGIEVIKAFDKTV
jgi:hypothetical protein